MGEINLLDRYPKARRDISGRADAQQRERETARKFGREYFDGDRTQGYGGYRYDGRWVPIARRMAEHWGLRDGCAVLDIGCAKGFLLHDFKGLFPRARLIGLDISCYAIEHAMEDMQPWLVRGTADRLPFPDASFDAVICINTLHNLPLERCKTAIREMERVGRRHKYLQVDSWLSEQQRADFERWVLTAVTYFEPEGWRKIFRETGYTGDYFWTVTE